MIMVVDVILAQISSNIPRMDKTLALYLTYEGATLPRIMMEGCLGKQCVLALVDASLGK